MSLQKAESGLVEKKSRPKSAGAVAEEAESSAPLPLAEGAPVVAVAVEVVVAAVVEGSAADVAAASPS